MRIRKLAICVGIITTVAGLAAAQSYYPPLHDWERRTPEQAGLDSRKLDEAIAFAKANETKASRDLERNHYTADANPMVRLSVPSGLAAASRALSCGMVPRR